MPIKYIAAPIKEGCTIDGADQGIPVLKEVFPFSALVRAEQQPESTNRKLLHLATITDFLWRLKRTEQVLPADFMVTVGGDHCLAIGSVSAHYQENMGLIWVDSHGDSNTDQTTITGRIHGMPLSVLMGLGASELTAVNEGHFIKKENVVLFGISSLDVEEKQLLEQLNVRIFYHQEIRERGLQVCLAEAVAYLAEKPVYVSYDLDSIDPVFCRGVNTPVQTGLSEAEAYQVLETLLTQLPVVSMDLVEYNPLNDDGNTLKIIRNFKAIIEKHKG
ncbi:MAG: arginase [Erysipelotrichaceae bacterium]|nr:arginase [Erysipelotrichaceae bacterium]